MTRPVHDRQVPHERAVLRTPPHERALSPAAARFTAACRTSHVAQPYRGLHEELSADHGGVIAPDEALAKSIALYHARRAAERSTEAGIATATPG